MQGSNGIQENLGKPISTYRRWLADEKVSYENPTWHY